MLSLQAEVYVVDRYSQGGLLTILNRSTIFFSSLGRVAGEVEAAANAQTPRLCPL